MMSMLITAAFVIIAVLFLTAIIGFFLAKWLIGTADQEEAEELDEQWHWN